MIKALSELNFVELSKYRFDSIEYYDGASSFMLNLSDIMPNGVVDLELEGIDQSKFVVDDDNNNCISFDEAFSGEFISMCRKSINPNRFAWILSCIFHEKTIDKFDMQLLEAVKVNVYEQHATLSICDQSFTRIEQIDIIKILRKTIEASEFSTISHGIIMEDEFDIKLFCRSNLYYGKFEYKTDVEKGQSPSISSDGFFKFIVDEILPNKNFIDVVNKIKVIETSLDVRNCLFIDMTNSINLTNKPRHESYNLDGSDELQRVNDIFSSVNSLGVNHANKGYDSLINELSKLYLDTYTKCLSRLKHNTNRQFIDIIGGKTIIDGTNIGMVGESESYLSRLINNNQINISELISKYYFSYKTINEINLSLLTKYIKARKADKTYSVDFGSEMYGILSDFFYNKCDELNDWIKPIIMKNSIFDFDFASLRYTSQKIMEINSEMDKQVQYMMGQEENESDSSLSPFSYIHVIFYEFYTHEFNKYREKINESIKKFINILSRFMFNKKVEATPSGLRIYNKDGIEIEPRQLSSGEQKILSLLLIAMFVEDVTLLLDEPEISISVIWQSLLLPVLINETSIKKIIVATHSPFLVEDETMIKYLQALS